VSKLNKNSDNYILIFAVVMTVVLGAVLSFVSLSLAGTQQAERDFEQKKFILLSVMGAEKVEAMTQTEVVAMYDAQVVDFVVDQTGKKIENLAAKDVFVGKEYKKLNKEGTVKQGEILKMPVYQFKSAEGVVLNYILPSYGFGLWDNIWGFVALESDLNTIKGVIFDHKGETPGLGARITEAKVQNRFVGKKMFDANGVASLELMKGEGKDYSGEENKVDGMSGATLTSNGLNHMFTNYFNLYKNYFSTIKS
jgi:Na+-transporting NADH:ubiquinone oxidoreductase subunit C